MRTFLGLMLTAVLVLTGCGGEDAVDDDVATDPAATSSSSALDTPSAVPDGPVDFTEIELVAQSNVGGEVDPTASALTDQEAVAEFSQRFDDARMGEALTQAFADADLAEDQVAMAAVVAIGCVPPTEVSEVERRDGRVTLTVAADPAGKDVQCLVPVTTVALVAVDADVVEGLG